MFRFWDFKNLKVRVVNNFTQFHFADIADVITETFCELKAIAEDVFFSLIYVKCRLSALPNRIL